jgi:hypothetical protein
VIIFDIPGSGPHTISPGSPLPVVADAVVIDGTTEPDFVSTPVIELDGSLAGATANGLKITAGGSTVRGLAINRFGRAGIDLRTGDGNLVERSFLGTDVSGTVDLGNGEQGVKIYDSDNNLIGSSDAGFGNVISGNDDSGVLILGGGTGNRIEGNLIGTDAAGTAALANTPNGVRVANSPGNTIGGTAAGAGNVVSGNDVDLRRRFDRQRGGRQFGGNGSCWNVSRRQRRDGSAHRGGSGQHDRR